MRKVFLILAAGYILLYIFTPEKELTPEQKIIKNRSDISLVVKMKTEQLIQANLKDPESMKDLSISVSLKDSAATAVGRAKNGFGGYSFFRAQTDFDYDSEKGTYQITNFKLD